MSRLGKGWSALCNRPASGHDQHRHPISSSRSNRQGSNWRYRCGRRPDRPTHRTSAPFTGPPLVARTSHTRPSPHKWSPNATQQFLLMPHKSPPGTVRPARSRLRRRERSRRDHPVPGRRVRRPVGVVRPLEPSVGAAIADTPRAPADDRHHVTTPRATTCRDSHRPALIDPAAADAARVIPASGRANVRDHTRRPRGPRRRPAHASRDPGERGRVIQDPAMSSAHGRPSTMKPKRIAGPPALARSRHEDQAQRAIRGHAHPVAHQPKNHGHFELK